MYTLIFDTEAIRYLEKLPKDVSQRIFTKLQECKSNPYHYFSRLTNRDEYRLRVGNYRVIADIDDTDIIIYVITIGHRKNIYKKRYD